MCPHTTICPPFLVLVHVSFYTTLLGHLSQCHGVHITADGEMYEDTYIAVYTSIWGWCSGESPQGHGVYIMADGETYEGPFLGGHRTGFCRERMRMLTYADER